MKRKVVTAFLMAALGSSLVFSQAAMAAGTADKTENTAEAGTEEETEDAETADATDAADKDAKDEDLKTIGEKPEGDTEGVFSAKLKNLTGKVITGFVVKNEDGMKITDDILGGPNFWPRWSTNDLYITTMEWFDLAQWIKDKKRTLSPTLQKQFESWGEDTNQLIVLCRKKK